MGYLRNSVKLAKFQVCRCKCDFLAFPWGTTFYGIQQAHLEWNVNAESTAKACHLQMISGPPTRQTNQQTPVLGPFSNVFFVVFFVLFCKFCQKITEEIGPRGEAAWGQSQHQAAAWRWHFCGICDWGRRFCPNAAGGATRESQLHCTFVAASEILRDLDLACRDCEFLEFVRFRQAGVAIELRLRSKGEIRSRGAEFWRVVFWKCKIEKFLTMASPSRHGWLRQVGVENWGEIRRQWSGLLQIGIWRV